MKRTSLVFLLALLATPLFADSGQRLIPAGSLISCNTGDSKISSKTTAIGDPILCKVQQHRGDFMLPYDSYLGGELTAAKDPGHLWGKGWMQLEFDRVYVGGTSLPIDAKVVDVPGYKIDAQGRVLGKGHAVRDTITWMIPILWPIDLINMPRRGPRPTLKDETLLTLRVMQDIVVPTAAEPQRDPYGLIPRSDSEVPAPPTQVQPDPAPQTAYAPAPEEQPAPEPAPVAYPAYPVYPAPPVIAYAPVPYVVAPAPYVVAPPVVYGGIGLGIAAGPRVAYGAGYYAGRPAVVAPRAAYGYGYAGRVAGPALQARIGGGGMIARGRVSAYRGR